MYRFMYKHSYMYVCIRLAQCKHFQYEIHANAGIMYLNFLHRTHEKIIETRDCFICRMEAF